MFIQILFFCRFRFILISNYVLKCRQRMFSEKITSAKQNNDNSGKKVKIKLPLPYIVTREKQFSMESEKQILKVSLTPFLGCPWLRPQSQNLIHMCDVKT